MQIILGFGEVSSFIPVNRLCVQVGLSQMLQTSRRVVSSILAREISSKRDASTAYLAPRPQTDRACPGCYIDCNLAQSQERGTSISKLQLQEQGGVLLFSQPSGVTRKTKIPPHKRFQTSPREEGTKQIMRKGEEQP